MKHIKVKSLKWEVRRIISLIFTLQETHFYRKGRVKIDDFKIFEAIHMKEHYRGSGEYSNGTDDWTVASGPSKR